MTSTRRRWWLVMAAVALGAGVTSPGVDAQIPYPTRPVDLIVGFAPGGGTDVTGRLIAAYASRKWGQPVNVVNMPGASGITAVLHVLDAPPDGYTLLVDAHGVSSMRFAVQRDVPFKMDAKTPIALVSLDPVIYTVKYDSPWKSLRDVAVAAKANPRAFRYALGGIAGVASFSIAQFLYAAGVPVADANRVVFSGGYPAITALAGGHVDFAGQQWSDSTDLINARKLRGLAVVHAARLPDLPDIPTAKETGFPDLDVVGWHGLSGPPGLPVHVVAKWAALVEEASKDSAFLEQALKANKVIAYKGPAAFSQFQEQERKKYLPLATQLGIRK